MITYYITIFIVFSTSLIAQSGIVYHQYRNNNYFAVKTKVFYCFAFVTTVILILVGGLRYRVGADYGNYIATYELRKEIWWSYVKKMDEPGIAIICKVSSIIYDNYSTMFFICSLITIGLFMNTIKKYSYSYVFSVLIFIFVGTWAGSFGAIRQYLAAAVLFAGHRYIYRRKLLRWIIVIIIAMQFHRTAIVMLPVYFIATQKINIRTICILFVSVIAIRFSYDYILDTMSFFKGVDQSDYSYMQTKVNIFRILVACAPILFYFIIYRRYHKEDNSETEFYNMMLFVNAALLIGTSNSAYLARVAIFTETYAVFALPRMIARESAKDRKIYKIIILGAYFLYFTYQIYSMSSLNNFQWIFSQ